MGKKRRILFAAMLVLILGGLAWWLLSPREPSYKGKSLRAWLQDYSLNFNLHYTTPPDADEAVRHIGTNAFPALLQMLRAKNSPLKTKFIELLGRQDLLKIGITPAWEKNIRASLAFEALGAEATNAVPDLVQIYEERISQESQESTVISIGEIGPPAALAIPSLLRGLATTNVNVRYNTVRALGWIHGQPETVVPALMEHLQDSNLDICGTSAQALGAFGTNARAAIPILVQKINAPG